MVKILFWYALFCALCIAIEYVNDKPSFTSGQVHDIKEPSVLDLMNNPSLYVINDYVNDVVLPARRFFYYENKYCNDRSSIYDLMHLFYLIVPIIFICKHLINMFSMLQSIIFIVVCLFFCFLTARVISSVYKRCFRLEPFVKSENELRKDFSRYNESFPISENTSFNNYVIERYLWYYHSISNRASRRVIFEKHFNGALAIIYFLFFYTSPFD